MVLLGEPLTSVFTANCSWMDSPGTFSGKTVLLIKDEQPWFDPVATLDIKASLNDADANLAGTIMVEILYTLD